MKEHTIQIMEALSDRFSLPPDILAGAPLLSMAGQSELFLEHYKGILEYTQERIRIQTGIGKLLVEGKNLVIQSYSKEDMRIIGYICKVEFCDARESI